MVRKLKSCGFTSFQVYQWEVGYKTRCDILNFTRKHVFVSQKVCRHTSFSVWIRAWRRLVVDKFAWKHVGRD